jgi:hypothetical protein
VHAVLALALPGAVKVNERGRGEAAGKEGKKREMGRRRKRIRHGGDGIVRRRKCAPCGPLQTNRPLRTLWGRVDKKDESANGPASIETWDKFQQCLKFKIIFSKLYRVSK